MNSERMQRVLDFNIGAMRERANVGVRRAAAFLGLSERFLEGEFPMSLTLGRSIKRQFIADPLPDDHVPELREAWQTWIVGNALRELDQFLSLYLDAAFDWTEQSKLVAGENPPHHSWKRIDGTTNVAEKHKRVLEAAKRFEAAHLDDHACLVSMSKVRNCLTHDVGIVTEKRATDGALVARWLALRTYIEQGDKTTVLEDTDLPFETDPDGPESRVYVKVDFKEKSFPLASRVQFTADELLDMCLFYQIVIDRVAEAIVAYARDCGVVFPDAPPAEKPTNEGSG